MASKADIIEALLFASEKPLTVERLGQIMEIPAGHVREEIEVLREEKARIGGLQLVEVATGWQMVTKPDHAPFLRKLREMPRQRLSRAAFEVLSIVGYRQPITRAEIDGLRGVDSAAPVSFLLEKKLIAFAGRRETPGRPWLLATTPLFLEVFGLKSIEDLPPLEELAALNEGAPVATAARELFNRGPLRPAEPVRGDSQPAAAKAAAIETAPLDPADAGIETEASVAETEAVQAEANPGRSLEPEFRERAVDAVAGPEAPILSTEVAAVEA